MGLFELSVLSPLLARVTQIESHIDSYSIPSYLPQAKGWRQKIEIELPLRLLPLYSTEDAMRGVVPLVSFIQEGIKKIRFGNESSVQS